MDETQHGITERGHGLRDDAGSDSTGVFAQDDVAAPVQGVLDPPMVAPQREEFFGAGSLGPQAGDGVSDFVADLAGTFPGPLDPAELGDARPVQMRRTLATDPEASCFDAAMALLDGDGLLEVGRWTSVMGRRQRAAQRVDQLRGEKRRQRRRRDRTSGLVGWL